MQQEWVAERLTVWASDRLAALVLLDMSLVPSADARPSSPDRSVVVVPGSSSASVSIGQSILAAHEPQKSGGPTESSEIKFGFW